MNEAQPETVRTSYSQILRSSSIIGGAQGVTYLITMARTKVVAVLLGPSGLGLIGLYSSAIQLVGTLTGLGIQQSGVREVAEAHGSGDVGRVARTIKTLQRACWVTGLLGWLLTAVLSYPLSQWVFGSTERIWAIALLGFVILVTSIGGGQRAVLRGTRRVSDLARVNVLGVSATTVIAVALYAWLGERGIIPVLIVSAAINLGLSWWFARAVQVIPISQSFSESLHNSKRLVGLGLAFMLSGLLAAGVALVIRGLIVRKLGLDFVGIYQAAWGLSGKFAAFILSAMSVDYFPRLTALSSNHTAMVGAVNEQTEIGILLALPGLLGTLIFAPWLMQIFYTAKFLPAAELLPWFVLGIFGRVLSWPMGFIMLAIGSSKWFAAAETVFAAVHLGFTILMLHILGLWGVALAFACSYGVYVLGMLWVGDRLIHFRWTPAVLRLLFASACLVTIGFLVQRLTQGLPEIVIGSFLTGAAGFFSLRGIAFRLGPQHRLVQFVCGLPGGSWICGI